MAEILVEEYYIEQLKSKIDKLTKQNQQLSKELSQTTDNLNHAEFRIQTELEPRIRQERRSYDLWVTQQTGEEQCNHFEYLVDELCNFVDDDYGENFEWEDAEGDLCEMILFLIKNREDIDIYEIKEKEDNA